jgi:hypothetical protein
MTPLPLPRNEAVRPCALNDNICSIFAESLSMGRHFKLGQSALTLRRKY